MENQTKKLFVYGLDCATPQLLFDKYLSDLPTFAKLMANGKIGLLKSTNPPITIPAWMSMFTGCDPGQMGFYGFTDRTDYSYTKNHIVNYSSVKTNAVWDYLEKNNLSSIVMGVPPTYPPKPINGIIIGDFMTPDASLDYTYPREIKEEINEISDGEYIIDVENFMMSDKKKLLEHIYEMTRRRNNVIRNFIKKKKWNLFIAMEIGLDRLHHGFWRFCFSDHILFEKGNDLENCIRDYYKFLDSELEKTILELDDNIDIMIVSDHGAKGSKGTFALNDWLVKNGYLFLKDKDIKKNNLDLNDVDWTKTKAWAKGGYYGRIFFNIKNREIMGIVDNNDLLGLEKEIKEKLSQVYDESGNEVKNIIVSPRDVYREIKNFPPDLFFYAGDLDYRVADSVGNGSLFLTDEGQGNDNANHNWNGIYISCKNPKNALKQGGISEIKELKNYSMPDIAPTILEYFGLEVPDNLVGTAIR